MTAFDVLVIGGGPAGLTASIYLSRFRRQVLVLDSGDGRAKRIPLSRNCPGFPTGISGHDLLKKMRRQTLAYGTQIRRGRAHSLVMTGEEFETETSLGCIAAKRVLICSGITDIVPGLTDRDRAIADGSLRLCPICDGYESLGKKIGVMGPESTALTEAQFLRTYTSDVTYLAHNEVSPRARTEALQHGVAVCEDIDSLKYSNPGFSLVRRSGRDVRFDAIYAAMGATANLEFATNLAPQRDPEGFLVVDDNQRTSVPGLYAAGDVVRGLKQLSVSFGHAAVAATEIHNDLRKAAR